METSELVDQINSLFQKFTVDMNKSVRGERGAKAAAQRARKSSKDLERLFLLYRKKSVQEIK